jgi:hypothetical protein
MKNALALSLVLAAAKQNANSSDSRRHGQGGSGEEDPPDPYWSSFLIADGRGAWVLETSGRTWAARSVDDGAAISNRITLGTDSTRASGDVPAGADFDAWRRPQHPDRYRRPPSRRHPSVRRHRRRCPHGSRRRRDAATPR